MKAKSLLIIFVIPLLLGFDTGKNLIPPKDTPIAIVKKFFVDVRYAKEANLSDWKDAQIGVPLNSGDQVKTGAKSLALILFTDGSGTITVRENAILNVYGKTENKRLNKNTVLTKGLIGFEVKKQEDEEFKFTTPTAVASIRGTGGSLEVNEEESTFLRLDSGKVNFQAIYGNKQSGELTAGNTLVIDKSGNVNITLQSDADKNKNSSLKNTNTKKVRIKTKDGDIEIEYYAPEDK
jgi:hypothetical protein